VNYLKQIVLTLILYLALLATAIAYDDTTGKDDAQVYRLFNNLNLVTNMKTRSGKDPKFFIKSVFPQLENDNIAARELDERNLDNAPSSETEEYGSIKYFNKLVNDLLQEEIATFRSNVSQNQTYLDKMPKDVPRSNNLYIDFDTSFIRADKNPILSIRFTIQGYIAGMAHPFHYHRVLNYDITEAETIQLNELFKKDSDYLRILSDYTRKSLSKRLDNKQMIEYGTAPKPENFKNWNIKPNGLLFTFDEYQVAPYVNGAQTVLVPYSLLKPILDKESVLYGCIKQRKKCFLSNVLTGGFIDTAINSKHRAFNPLLGKA
jgi:hypothetical protein